MIRAHEHREATLADHTATASPLSGVDLIDLGPRRLRDIAKVVELFQVRAPGSRTEFPPLRTIDSPPGNLRPPTSSFSAARRSWPRWRPC
jgi:hypothetical protein